MSLTYTLTESESGGVGNEDSCEDVSCAVDSGTADSSDGILPVVSSACWDPSCKLSSLVVNGPAVCGFSSLVNISLALRIISRAKDTLLLAPWLLPELF